MKEAASSLRNLRYNCRPEITELSAHSRSKEKEAKLWHNMLSIPFRQLLDTAWVLVLYFANQILVRFILANFIYLSVLGTLGIGHRCTVLHLYMIIKKNKKIDCTIASKFPIYTKSELKHLQADRTY